ncbi:MAG: ArdC-like ssDNA-binding domain-containing protein [Acidimicrobiales bacterium]
MPQNPAEANRPVSFGELEKAERIKAMQSEIEQAITNMSDHEGWQRFLDTMSKFHHYSFGNTMLIAMQKPDATYVAGFKNWKNEHNRTVKKGEKGIWILAPVVKKVEPEDGSKEKETSRVVGFRSVAVFDVSQTEGEPLPDPGLNMHDLAPGEAPPGMVENLTQILRDQGFCIERGDTGDAKGHTDFLRNAVVISDKVNDRQAAKTLAHEAAHVVLGHGERIHEYHSGNGRPDMEIEAESVAYIVSKHWQLDDVDTYSFGYVDRWAHGDAAKVKKSAEAVVKAARVLTA